MSPARARRIADLADRGLSDVEIACELLCSLAVVRRALRSRPAPKPEPEPEGPDPDALLRSIAPIMADIAARMTETPAPAGCQWPGKRRCRGPLAGHRWPYCEKHLARARHKNPERAERIYDLAAGKRVWLSALGAQS